MRLAAVALLAACHAQPAPSTPPRNACGDATTQLVARIEQLAAKAGHAATSDDRAQLDQFRDAMTTRCTEDAWSDDAIRCFRDSTDETALATCIDKLSPAQRANVDRIEFPARRATDSAAIAKRAVENYAFEAYPMWAAAHPDTACPATLAELREYTSNKDDNDPWGHPYKMMCGASLPMGAHGLAIASAGPDGAFDTADDIRSW
jgi:hypothetical protein